jgi:hypothetical protein
MRAFGARADEVRDDAHERDKIVRIERYRHEARSEIAVEEAREAMTLPATAAERSLDDRLRESPEPVPFHIDDLARRHNNVVVAAQYKTGKTSLAVERVRAEVDGLPFLDSFATKRIDGNVGFWNTSSRRATWTTTSATSGSPTARRSRSRTSRASGCRCCTT